MAPSERKTPTGPRGDELFRLLVDRVSDYAIFVLEPTGHVATWNKGAQRIKQYESGEIIGKHFSIFYSPEEASSGKCDDELATAIKDGRFEEEGWRYRKDGTRFWASVLITALRDETGELVGFAKVTRDLSDRLSSEQERLALVRSETADRSKDEFLSIIGHELRNPLAPMTSAIHLLKAKAGPGLQRELDVLERQVTQMTRLVDDLTDVATTLRDNAKIDPKPIEISLILDRALEVAASLFEAHRHSVTVDVPRSGLVVGADVERMTQVFGNLLNNAAKYTDDGGEIVVRALRQGREIIVQIEDNGRGIEPHNRDRVFDLFTQGERGLDRRGSGLGVGLAVAKEFVKKHGGAISVDSPGVGHGATFTVRLPRVTALDTPLPFPPVAAQASTRRLVLIDDNEDAVVLMAESLRRLGHEVEHAVDGASGLALIEAFVPDVVFLDIGLPGMNGYDVVRAIRKTELGARLPVYALTGYANAAHRDEALRAGFTAHVPKPVTIEALQAVLSLPLPPKG